MGFNVIQFRQTGDEKIEVGLLVVLNPKVIDDENKDN
jgi:hypothetical protein